MDRAAVARDRVGIPDYVGLVYGLVLVWGLGDLLSTFAAHAAAGPVGRELNPLVSLMLETEPLLVIALKAGVVLYAGVVLLACRNIVRSVPGWRLWLSTLVGLGTLVVVNNLAVALVA